MAERQPELSLYTAVAAVGSRLHPRVWHGTRDGETVRLGGEGLSILDPNNPDHGKPIAPGARIGHVHLKVADLERALGFYCGVLGFTVTQRIGRSAAFIAAGGYHHHIGLNTWESRRGPPPAPGSTGLYHLAILYPTRADLGDALRRLIAAKIPLEGASDHGVSQALYLRDPDGNGVELYSDRPVTEWPVDHAGNLAMVSGPLDLHALLAEPEPD